MSYRRRNPRYVKKSTLLVVGEGPSDKAFLNHLKEIYCHNTYQKVTVEAEDGGSPDVMVHNVIRKHQHQAFDRKVLLLDEDIHITDAIWAKAHKGKLELIISTPTCLEGMLLEVLGYQVGIIESHHCKSHLHPMLSGPETKRESYRELFPKTVIDSCSKEQIVRLRQLLKNEDG